MAKKNDIPLDIPLDETVEPGGSVPVAEAAPVNVAGFCAYIGPSVHGVIVNGTIFPKTKTDTIKELADIIEKYPLVESLIVPGDTLAESRVKVKTPGNLLYLNYKKMSSGKMK